MTIACYVKDHDRDLTMFRELTASEYTEMTEDAKQRLHDNMAFHFHHALNMAGYVDGDTNWFIHAEGRLTDNRCMYAVLMGIRDDFARRLKALDDLCVEAKQGIKATENLARISDLANKGTRIMTSMHLIGLYVSFLNDLGAGCDAMIRGEEEVNRSTSQGLLDEYIEVTPPAKGRGE